MPEFGRENLLRIYEFIKYCKYEKEIPELPDMQENGRTLVSAVETSANSLQASPDAKAEREALTSLDSGSLERYTEQVHTIQH